MTNDIATSLRALENSAKNSAGREAVINGVLVQVRINKTISSRGRLTERRNWYASTRPAFPLGPVPASKLEALIAEGGKH